MKCTNGNPNRGGERDRQRDGGRNEEETEREIRERQREIPSRRQKGIESERLRGRE